MIKKKIKIIIKKYKKQIYLLRHRGSKYKCPFCDFSARNLTQIGYDFPILQSMQVVGGGLRKGGCYKCGSNDRERLVYIFLKNELQIFKNVKDFSILHIAPEENLSNKMLEFGFSNYICGDFFAEGYKYPEYVQNINILNIPFADNAFDLILCNHVLEHIIDDSTAMKELYRVLKIGGKAILQVPISKNTVETIEDFSIVNPAEREITFGQYDHVRIYGQDYQERLQKCGFKLHRMNISKKHEKFGLNIDEDVFLVEKLD